jgi:N4-gp56 family major capsid protein
MYASGSRGANADFHEPTDYTGHGGNAFVAPDPAHLMYAGSATSAATVASTDRMTRVVVERAATLATMIKVEDNESTRIQPVTMEGGEHYALVMTPWQEHDMRVADTSGWVEIQKAAAAAEGRKNPLFTGALGMIKRVVLQSHEHVIRFTNYGSGSNVAAARALFLGRQAVVLAYGTSKGLRYDWQEELKDYKNQVNIASGLIIGMKKSRFNNRDFGVIAIDTAASNPH